MAMKPRGVIALATIVLVAMGVSAGAILAAPAPPTASIKIVPVAANPADPHVIEAKLSDGKTITRLGTTGLPNVSIGVPVTLAGSATDPTAKLSKVAWTLSKPTASKATLTSTNESVVKFTPDVSGVYKVDLVVTGEGGNSPMASVKISAGQYIGTGEGNCFQCHPRQTQEWSETGHGKILTEEINGGVEPAISHYGEGCIRCHSTGYYPGVDNGGFAAVAVQTGWQFPALSEIQKGKGVWEAMPVALQNMSNIQCEVCHGPARDHVEKGTPMAASLDEGVCNVCHAASASHRKGSELAFAGHADATAQSWTYPVGPSRQGCVRCHSGAGYVSFIKNPTEQASWDNSMQTVTCSVCHDPHSDANKFQLRITGRAVEATSITKDYGLSANCVECHNARTVAADAVKGSTPHYSVAGEMLADTGGVTYGLSIPNSAHGMVVGAFPVPNPDRSAEATTLFGGSIPGSCVACHMYPTKTDANDPGRMKVGEHSFNMTSPDGKSANTESCQTCHAGITAFDLAAKADYDGNGKVETVRAEVKGALGVLLKAINDSGIKSVQGHPYFDAADKAKASAKQNNAIYNYLFVRGPEGADGSANAIHNFKRSIALLQASYRDLTGKEMANATQVR